MTLVEDALREGGYTFDARVYDAADYGAATRRKRLLLRAVKDGELPPAPAPTHGPGRAQPYADWYAAVEDLVDGLPDDKVPPWMRRRLEAAGVNPDAPSKPTLVMGGSAGKNVPYAEAGGPAPTFKATPGEAHRIIFPDGRVKRVTPRAAARITGLPDDYPLPTKTATATTIIGNGVPPALSEAVFAPLLAGERVPGSEVLYSRAGAADAPDVAAAEPLPVFRSPAATEQRWHRIGDDHQYTELTLSPEGVLDPSLPSYAKRGRMSSGRGTGFASGMYAFADARQGTVPVLPARNPLTLRSWGLEVPNAAAEFQRDASSLLFLAERLRDLSPAKRAEAIDLLRARVSSSFEEAYDAEKRLASPEFGIGRGGLFTALDPLLSRWRRAGVPAGLDGAGTVDALIDAAATWGKHQHVHPVNILLSRMGHDGIEWAGGALKEGNTGAHGFVKFPPITADGALVDVVPDPRHGYAVTHGGRDSRILYSRAADAGATTPEEAAEAAAAWRALKTESPWFKRFFGGSKVVDETGAPKRLYHGTTHDFEAFDVGSGNVENHHGRGIYLTSASEDVGANYATREGPDLKSRIESQMESLLDVWDDPSVAQDFVERWLEAHPERAAEGERLVQVLDDGGNPDANLVQEITRWVAEQEIAGSHGGAVLPVYAAIKNPIDLRPGKVTRFDIETEWSPDGEDLIGETGAGVEVLDAIRRMSNSSDTSDRVIEALGDISDGFDAADLERAVRDNSIEFLDDDSSAGQFLQDVYRELGFDGIVIDAYKTFGPRRAGWGGNIPGMAGLTPGTEHWVAFEPTQVKSATGNRGTFDPKDKRLLYSRAPAGTRVESGGDSQVWQDAGVRLSADEADFEVVRDRQGKVLGASSFGIREDSGEATFSVAVQPEARRRGIARLLVERILAAHPGTSFNVWVVNPHMAELLETVGFDTASARGWSPDAPHMTFRTPTRREAAARAKAQRALAVRRAESSAAAPGIARAAAEGRLARIEEVAAKAPSDVVPEDLEYLDPARFETDPELVAAILQRRAAGELFSPIPGEYDLLIPLTEDGILDEKRLARRKAAFAFQNDYARGALAEPSGGLLYSRAPDGVGRSSSGFYSGLRRAVESIPQERLSADQVWGAIAKGAVRPDEVTWTRLEQFLAENPRTTKQEVLAWLDENAVVVEEKTLSNTSYYGPEPAAPAWAELKAELLARGATAEEVKLVMLDPIGDSSVPAWERLFKKADDADYGRLVELSEAYVESNTVPSASGLALPLYGNYQLSGGTNYRELLFKLPGSVYRSTHFGDDGLGLMAHARISDRLGPNGEKILLVEEVQSDWHQAGRKAGYTDPARAAEVARLHAARVKTFSYSETLRRRSSYIPDPTGQALAAYNAAHKVALAAYKAWEDVARTLPEGATPNAPFSKTWHELVMKRVLRMASEGDYAGVAWAPGVEQVRRYPEPRRMAVDSVKWGAPDEDGLMDVVGFRGGKEVFKAALPKPEALQLLDLDVAERIAAGEVSGEAAGAGMTLGGRGMKGFYDTKLPLWADKYARKLDPSAPRVSESLVITNPDYTAADLLDVPEAERPDVETWLRSNDAVKVHYLPVTPRMRERILSEGQPLFSRAPDGSTRGSIEPAPPTTREGKVRNPAYDKWVKARRALALSVAQKEAAEAAAWWATAVPVVPTDPAAIKALLVEKIKAHDFGYDPFDPTVAPAAYAEAARIRSLLGALPEAEARALFDAEAPAHPDGTSYWGEYRPTAPTGKAPAAAPATLDAARA